VDNSNTLTCTQNSHLTTAETFTFIVSYVSLGGYNDLTVDENSKTLTIDPNYTEESGNTNKDGAGNFHKFSSFLLIGAGLVL
jgi:hypothetical protein